MNRAELIEFKSADNLLISEFISDGLRGKSDNTIKAYRQSLERFKTALNDAGTGLDGYGRTDVQAYIKRLENVDKRKPSGVAREFAAIRAFSKWAGKSEAIEDIRIKRAAKRGQAPKWLSRNEYLAIRRKLDRKRNRRDLAIFEILAGAGLRVSELVALDKSDVIMSDRKGEIRVRNGKGEIERTIPINSETRKAIRDYLNQRGDDGIEALFISQLRRRISVRSVQTMLEKYDITPHQLRHTFVKALVDKGYSDALIMSLSGHSSAEMIAIYSSPSEEERREAVESLYD